MKTIKRIKWENITTLAAVVFAVQRLLVIINSTGVTKDTPIEVGKSNEIARNLYKKYGFREVALRKFYYGDEDGILMEKQVL